MVYRHIKEVHVKKMINVKVSIHKYKNNLQASLTVLALFPKPLQILYSSALVTSY